LQTQIRKWVLMPIFWILFSIFCAVGYLLIGGYLAGNISSLFGVRDAANSLGNIWSYYIIAVILLGVIGANISFRAYRAKIFLRLKITAFLTLPLLALIVLVPFAWQHGAQENRARSVRLQDRAALNQRIEAAKSSVLGLGMEISSTSRMSEFGITIVHDIHVKNQTGNDIDFLVFNIEARSGNTIMESSCRHIESVIPYDFPGIFVIPGRSQFIRGQEYSNLVEGGTTFATDDKVFRDGYVSNFKMSFVFERTESCPLSSENQYLPSYSIRAVLAN
jgi:hypothetical protein